MGNAPSRAESTAAQSSPPKATSAVDCLNPVNTAKLLRPTAGTAENLKRYNDLNKGEVPQSEEASDGALQGGEVSGWVSRLATGPTVGSIIYEEVMKRTWFLFHPPITAEANSVKSSNNVRANKAFHEASKPSQEHLALPDGRYLEENLHDKSTRQPSSKLYSSINLFAHSKDTREFKEIRTLNSRDPLCSGYKTSQGIKISSSSPLGLRNTPIYHPSINSECYKRIESFTEQTGSALKRRADSAESLLKAGEVVLQAENCLVAYPITANGYCRADPNSGEQIAATPTSGARLNNSGNKCFCPSHKRQSPLSKICEYSPRAMKRQKDMFCRSIPVHEDVINSFQCFTPSKPRERFRSLAPSDAKTSSLRYSLQKTRVSESPCKFMSASSRTDSVCTPKSRPSQNLADLIATPQPQPTFQTARNSKDNKRSISWRNSPHLKDTLCTPDFWTKSYEVITDPVIKGSIILSAWNEGMIPYDAVCNNVDVVVPVQQSHETLLFPREALGRRGRICLRNGLFKGCVSGLGAFNLLSRDSPIYIETSPRMSRTMVNFPSRLLKSSLVPVNQTISLYKRGWEEKSDDVCCFCSFMRQSNNPHIGVFPHGAYPANKAMNSNSCRENDDLCGNSDSPGDDWPETRSRNNPLANEIIVANEATREKTSRFHARETRSTKEKAKLVDIKGLYVNHAFNGYNSKKEKASDKKVRTPKSNKKTLAPHGDTMATSSTINMSPRILENFIDEKQSRILIPRQLCILKEISQLKDDSTTLSNTDIRKGSLDSKKTHSSTIGTGGEAISRTPGNGEATAYVDHQKIENSPVSSGSSTISNYVHNECYICQGCLSTRFRRKKCLPTLSSSPRNQERQDVKDESADKSIPACPTVSVMIMCKPAYLILWRYSIRFNRKSPSEKYWAVLEAQFVPTKWFGEHFEKSNPDKFNLKVRILDQLRAVKTFEDARICAWCLAGSLEYALNELGFEHSIKELMDGMWKGFPEATMSQDFKPIDSVTRLVCMNNAVPVIRFHSEHSACIGIRFAGVEL